MLANTQKMKHQAPRQYLSALRTEQIEMFGKTGRKAKRMLAEKENLKQSVRFFVKLLVTLLKVTFMGELFFNASICSPVRPNHLRYFLAINKWKTKTKTETKTDSKGRL